MTYKDIREFSCYMIDANGNIFSKITNKVLRQMNNGFGYRKVTLRKNNKSYQKYVHRLLATTFIPNPNNYPQVDHIDGNRSNNVIDNLRWVDESTNQTNPNHGRYKNKTSVVTQYPICVKLFAKKLMLQGKTTVQVSHILKIKRQTLYNWNLNNKLTNKL